MTERTQAGSFLRDAAAFSAPLVVLFVVLELAMRRVPSSYSLKRDLVDALGATTTVLVLGSSHEAYGVRPSELGEHALNMANSSQSSLLDAALGEQLVTRMPDLELVIIGVSYFSFGYRLDASPEGWRAGFYQHYFGVHEPTEALRLPQLGDLSVAALYDPAQMFAAWRGHFPLRVEDRGWERAEVSGGALLLDEAVARDRAAFHEAMIADARRPATVEALVAFLATLHAHGVRAAFVSMPEHALYREHLGPETLRRNEEDLAAVRAAWPTPWLDLRADARFHDDHFVNHDHLDVLGATEASRILRRELVDAPPSSGSGHLSR